MASPLILRITSKFDNSGFNQSTQASERLVNTLSRVNASAGDSFSSFEKMTASMAGVRIEASKIEGSSGLQGFQRSIRSVLGQVRLLRREIFFGALIAAPFILAAKSAIDTQREISNLTNKLNALGQAGEFEANRLLKLTTSFASQGLIGTKDSLTSLDLLIQKTKSASEAEQILNLAQQLHFATGVKVVDATKAIADALTGNSKALSDITQKTQFQINTLVESGTAVRALSNEFENASDRGLRTFSGSIESLGIKLKNAISNEFRIRPNEEVQKFLDVKGLKESLSGLSDISKSLDFTSIDGLRSSLGQLQSTSELFRKALASPEFPQEVRRNISSFLPAVDSVIKQLDEQIKKEQQLSTVERERLSTNAELIASENALVEARLKLQNQRITATDETKDETNLAKQVERRKANLQRQQLLEEAFNKVRARNSQLTEEEIAEFSQKDTQNRIQSLLNEDKVEADTNAKTLARVNNLKQAEIDLASFRLQNRIDPHGGITSSKEQEFAEEQLFRNRLALLKQNAIEEAEQRKASGDLNLNTAQTIASKERLQEEQLLLERAEQVKKRNDLLKTLTQDQIKQQEKDAQEQAQKLQDIVDQIRPGGAGRGIAQELADLVKGPSTNLNPDQGFVKQLQDAIPNTIKTLEEKVRGLLDEISKEGLSIQVGLKADPLQTQTLANNIGQIISQTVIRDLVNSLGIQGIVNKIFNEKSKAAGND